MAADTSTGDLALAVVSGKGSPARKAAFAGAVKGSGGALALETFRRNRGNVGMRVPMGRTFNANSGTTTEITDELLIAVASTDVYAAAPVLCVSQTPGGTAAAPNANVAVRPVPDTTNAASNAAFHRNVTFGGSFTVPLTPALAPNGSRRRYIIGDPVALPITPRTDGGPGSLFVIRAHRGAGRVITSGTSSGIGSAAADYAGWATHPSGMVFRMRTSEFNADYANASIWDQFASGQPANGSTIAGIIVWSTNKVQTLYVLDDSNGEGAGGSLFLDNWAFRMMLGLNAANLGVTFELANLGWSGQTTAQITQQGKDAVSQGVILPGSLAMIPFASPNTIGNRAMTNDDFYGAAGNPGSSIYTERAALLSALQNASVKPDIMYRSWFATDSSVYNFGASDSMRRADNTTNRKAKQAGYGFNDQASIIDGAIVNGQTQMIVTAGTAKDGIHLNDPMRDLVVPEALRAFYEMYGLAA